MRRNLKRYEQRRDNLRRLFIDQGWISDGEPLSESGKNSTYETLYLRSKAAQDEISLKDLARVLLSINKKRGYKSSRKTDSGEDGQLIDGMSIAKELANTGKTPAEFALESIKSGKSGKFDFYRSDLEKEFERIWDCQQSSYPELLTDEFKSQLSKMNKTGATKAFFAKYKLTTAENKGKDRLRNSLEWRVSALKEPLDKEKMALSYAS